MVKYTLSQMKVDLNSTNVIYHNKKKLNISDSMTMPGPVAFTRSPEPGLESTWQESREQPYFI
jgi:hypothetical protein